MNGEFLIIALIAAGAVLVFLLAKLASFLKAFSADTCYICHKMDDADSYEEYRRWRGELRCHYLMLIPFVNEKNVMDLYHRIFHRADRAGEEKRKDSIAPLLMPSILGMCICLVCVCGMTWAWYSTSVQTAPKKMTAAYYEVTVASVRNGGASVEPANGGYPLESGTTYSVALYASGTVEKCGGYCLIELSGSNRKYYTQTILPDHSITISFTPDAEGIYTFTGVWGSHPVGVTEEMILKNAGEENPASVSVQEPDTVPAVNATPESVPKEPPAETEISDVYTVQPGDTLSGIAKICSVPVDKIAAYNGIADVDAIHVGQIIRIPPEDWEIPAEDPNPSDVPPEPTESVSDLPEASQENVPEEPATDPSEDVPSGKEI